MSLYQRVRPVSFAEIVGNQETIANLQALTTQSDPPHVYLLTGPSGCGKTTLGRLIALSLGVNREHVLSQTGDYREVDSVRFRDVETIREIRDSMGYKAMWGGRRCWLLDEVHRLPGLSQDALLKGLEDTPPHVFFVLCTTEPERLSEMIRSRCSIHRVEELSKTDMVRLLHRTASGEGHRLARAQLSYIAEKTECKPRAAIQLLEKVLVADLEARDAIIANAEVIKDKANDLAKALYQRSGWYTARGILSEIDEDNVETTRRAVVGYCTKVLLNGENDWASKIMELMVEPFFSSGREGFIFACYRICRSGDDSGDDLPDLTGLKVERK